MATITLPTPGGNPNVWGPILNDAITAVNDEVEGKEWILTAGTNITIDRTDPDNPVISASGGGGGVSDWGDIGGTLADQTDLQTALNAKAPLASPTLTGTPTAPNVTASDDSTKIANTAHVKDYVESLGGIPIVVQWDGSSWGTYVTDSSRVRWFDSSDDIDATAPTYYNTKDKWFTHPEAV